MMKAKHPILTALATIGGTIAGIVGVFVIGTMTALIFGDESAPFYFFSYCFTLLAPIALLIGIIFAIRRFVRDRRALKPPAEK